MSDATPSPSRRDPNLIPLSHDHHNGLARARDIVLALDGVVPCDLAELATTSHHFAQTDLLPHFEREEQWLLPPFLGYVGTDDPDVVLFYQQHRDLRQLTAGLADTASSLPLAERLLAWSQALTAHIRFEERTLFKRVQATLSSAEMATLGKALAPQERPACDR